MAVSGPLRDPDLRLLDVANQLAQENDQAKPMFNSVFLKTIMNKSCVRDKNGCSRATC